MPASVGSPIAAANSVTENSPTSGAPGPATGIPVSPWSHTVAASARESTECIAAQATAACSLLASAASAAAVLAPARTEHRGGGVEVGGGAPGHDLIPAPSTDTQAPKTGFSTGVRETFFEKFFDPPRRARNQAAWSRQARPPSQRRGLDGLDHRGSAWSRQARPPGVGVVSTGSTTGGRRGLDGLDHRGLAWSRQARPPSGGVVSTGSTTGGWRGLDRLDHRVGSTGGGHGGRARPRARTRGSGAGRCRPLIPM